MLQKNWNVCSCLTEQPSVLDDAEELPGLNHLLGMSVFLLFAGFFCSDLIPVNYICCLICVHRDRYKDRALCLQSHLCYGV